ncbi:MAG: STAS domain-containing protein [Candidatus Paceibacterota bacterium]
MFQTRMEGKILITVVVGNFADRAKFKALVFPQLEKSGVQRVVCDHTECGYIDTACLGALVSLARKSGELNKGRVVLVGLNEYLRTLFENTGLGDLFDIYTTLADALRAIALDDTLVSPKG